MEKPAANHHFEAMLVRFAEWLPKGSKQLKYIFQPLEVIFDAGRKSLQCSCKRGGSAIVTTSKQGFLIMTPFCGYKNIDFSFELIASLKNENVVNLQEYKFFKKLAHEIRAILALQGKHMGYR